MILYPYEVFVGSDILDFQRLSFKWRDARILLP